MNKIVESLFPCNVRVDGILYEVDPLQLPHNRGLFCTSEFHPDALEVHQDLKGVGDNNFFHFVLKKRLLTISSR